MKQGRKTYGRVVIGKGIVDAHILKEPSDVVIKETLNFFEVELRVDEYCPNVSFNYIGKALQVFCQILQMVGKQLALPSEGFL